jgi:hypothetical protein
VEKAFPNSTAMKIGDLAGRTDKRSPKQQGRAVTTLVVRRVCASEAGDPRRLKGSCPRRILKSRITAVIFETSPRFIGRQYTRGGGQHKGEHSFWSGGAKS